MICRKETGMLPAPSPTKCCKSCSMAIEADVPQIDLHNKHILLGERESEMMKRMELSVTG